MPLAVDGMKLCPTCNEDLPVTRFPKNRSKPDGYASQCGSCRNGKVTPDYGLNRRRKKTREDRQIGYQIKRKYGLGVCELTRMRIECSDRCGICGEPELKNQRLSIDHDHETGRIRGLLCSACNLGLGSFRDNTKRLESAIHWLAS